MCALRLTHMGRNYPCLTDPNLGVPSPSATTAVSIDSLTNTGVMQFTMLSNWGELLFSSRLQLIAACLWDRIQDLVDSMLCTVTPVRIQLFLQRSYSISVHSLFNQRRRYSDIFFLSNCIGNSGCLVCCEYTQEYLSAWTSQCKFFDLTFPLFLKRLSHQFKFGQKWCDWKDKIQEESR